MEPITLLLRLFSVDSTKMQYITTRANPLLRFQGCLLLPVVGRKKRAHYIFSYTLDGIEQTNGNEMTKTNDKFV